MMMNPANMAKNGTLLFCRFHDRFSVVFIHTLYATVLNTDREMTNITMIITILLTNACSIGAFVRGFLFALQNHISTFLYMNCSRPQTHFMRILLSSPEKTTRPIHECVFLTILPR